MSIRQRQAVAGDQSPAHSEATTTATAKGEGKNPHTSYGIWVAVRVRPFNKRELNDSGNPSDPNGLPSGPQTVVELERDRKTMTLLDPTKGYTERANFTFDYCFSHFAPSVVLFDGKNPRSPGGAGTDSDDDDEEVQAELAQAEIYKALGHPIVQSAWAGYNGCIFAYGQTSSGKTYTMMGTKRDPGVIPRLCRSLFEQIEEEQIKAARNLEAANNNMGTGSSSGGNASRKVIKCQVSYMEIYNEQVRDLLKTRERHFKPQFKTRFDNKMMQNEYESLRVRQHPLHGPFVEGITKLDVENWLDCVRIIRQGNEMRSQATTALNDASSRSHAIFQMVLTQTEAFGAVVRGKEITNHKVSKINLVDLAGSERISHSGVTGKHMTEANYINKSLSTLRKVIDVLVQKKTSGQTVVVPYRESLLTWILSDNFGGNSKTAMIANVSPHYANFLETESTMRYATLAKGIINRVRVNEDPSAKLIRELQAQLKQLQVEMAHGPNQDRIRELEDQMEENKRAMEELIAREEGMRQLIHESRLREERLRHEKESLEKDHQHWKDEAQKLRREKEELKHQLIKLAEGGVLDKSKLLSSNKDDFWMLGDEEGGDGGAKSSQNGEEGEGSAASGGGGGGASGAGDRGSRDLSGSQKDDIDPSGQNESLVCPPQPKHRRRSSVAKDPHSKGNADNQYRPQTSEIPEGPLDPKAESGKDNDTDSNRAVRNGENNNTDDDNKKRRHSEDGFDAVLTFDESPAKPKDKSRASASDTQRSQLLDAELGLNPDSPHGAEAESSEQRRDDGPATQDAHDDDDESPSKPPPQSAPVTTPSQSPGPNDPRPDTGVRYGRRAMTEEGGNRDQLANRNSDENAPSSVRTAEHAQRRRGSPDSGGGGQAGSQAPVPLSLQHLAGAGGGGGVPKKRAGGQPDALDAFLSGGGAQVKEKGVPPWRQKKN